MHAVYDLLFPRELRYVNGTGVDGRKDATTKHAPECHFLRKLVPNKGPTFPISSTSLLQGRWADLLAGKGYF